MCAEWRTQFQTELQAAILQLRWKIIFPFLAKSCAHAHMYAYEHESLQGMGSLQWISVALENSVERVSCPDNKQYTLLILSGHETSSTEFSNATEIHCNWICHDQF